MSPDPNSESSSETGEKQLCVSCMFPNEPNANFCVSCGAPLTSYASTGPFEHILAECAVYRKAAEQPKSFVVLLGVWIIFGMMTLAGGTAIALGLERQPMFAVIGAFAVVVSIVMIAKTTRNHFAKKP